MLIGCLEASQYLGVSIKTVRRWAQKGQLRGSKVGPRGDWRFAYEDLDKLIQQTSVEPFTDIVLFLKRNAETISHDACEKHKKGLRLSDNRFKKVQTTTHLSYEIVKPLADNLSDVNRGKRAFEQLSIKIAEDYEKQLTDSSLSADAKQKLMRSFLKKQSDYSDKVTTAFSESLQRVFAVSSMLLFSAPILVFLLKEKELKSASPEQMPSAT